jgi:hypothetical protein
MLTAMQIIARPSVWRNLEVKSLHARSFLRMLNDDEVRMNAIDALFKSRKRFVSVEFVYSDIPIRFVYKFIYT